MLCCFALFVCLTLLASFFLPSHLSFKNMYIYVVHVYTCTQNIILNLYWHTCMYMYVYVHVYAHTHALGDLMGALCRVGGGGGFGELMPYLTGGIQGNLERDSGEVELVERFSSSSSSSSPNTSPTSGGRVGTMRVFLHVCVSTSLHYSPSPQPSSPSAAQVFHDTAGWRHLETYMA